MIKITNEELNEIFERTKIDGVELYNASQSLKKISFILILLIAVLGLLASFMFFGNSEAAAGLIVLATTIAVCYIFYLVQILLINTSKMIVNISFLGLVIAKDEGK